MFAASAPAAAPAAKPAADDKDDLVIVIPVKGMIERGLLYVVRRSLAQAVKENADAVIFDMDTPGGRLDTTEEMIHLLMDLPEEITTYTFVNKDALSAGAMIALATDEIYMAPGSRIGASALVSMFGEIKEGDLKEKVVSATVALVTSAAQSNGHDEKLVEAMIRKDVEYKIGEKMICPEGQLLVLTDHDASRLVGEESKQRPLLSKGTVESMDLLLKELGLTDAKIERITISGAEKIARWIERFTLLFLVGGLLGLYIEFKTPGFGVPGIAGILLLTVFFWGHNIAGLAGMGEIIMFILGAILLLVEIFVIPGFGIVGATGIALMVASILMAMIQHSPGLPWYSPPMHQVESAAVVFSLAVIISIVLMIALARILPHTTLFDHLAISAVVEGHVDLPEDKRAEALVGRSGTAVTDLRPAGIAEFGGKRLDVVAQGDFIEKGSTIVIAEVHGNRIVVRT